MIKIHPKSNEPLQAFKCKSGQKQDGQKWEWIKVKGLGKDKTTAHLWINNLPSNVKEGEFFRVTEILDSTIKYDKNPQTGEWSPHPQTYYTVNVVKVDDVPKGYKPEPWSEEKKKFVKDERATFYEIHEDDDGLPF